MAERKSALERAPERPELPMLLERAKTAVLTDDMLKEQMASFVHGNAPKGSRITKDLACRALEHIRVRDAHGREYASSVVNRARRHVHTGARKS